MLVISDIFEGLKKILPADKSAFAWLPGDDSYSSQKIKWPLQIWIIT